MNAPRMMTLAEAKAVFEKERGAADVRDTFIRWDDPTDSGIEVLDCPSEIGQVSYLARCRIGRALLAYAAHLSHEAGRAFELAAVKRLVAVRSQEEAECNQTVAYELRKLYRDIDTGLHHAESEHK